MQIENSSKENLTYPTQAGQIKKGDYCMLKKKPCKVTQILYSKTGKHGHRKCHFYGTNIFTEKKIEDIQTSNHHMNVPFVEKREYLLLDISEEDHFCTLVPEDSDETREDLKLPTEPCYSEMVQKLIEDFEAEVDNVYVTSLAAMGEEKILAYRLDSS